MSQEPRARLFVALELPDQARDALLAWGDEALVGLEGLRLTARDHLHVTLCFLGWQRLGEIEAIVEACRAGSVHAAMEELELGPAVWLPPRHPRMLAVDLVDPGGAVGRLQATLADRLERGSWYEPEKQPFRPHVTVARVGGGAWVAKHELTAPPGRRFSALTLSVFRSHLSPRGARYEVLARWGLTSRRGT